MNAAVRAQLPWLPPTGLAWHVEAGEHWDAVRVPRTIGLAALNALGNQHGAVICDAWPRILYFLTESGSTKGWNVGGTFACGPATYVVVPALAAPERALHWAVMPTDTRLYTDTDRLRDALEAAVDAKVGPRHETEHRT